MLRSDDDVDGRSLCVYQLRSFPVRMHLSPAHPLYPPHPTQRAGRPGAPLPGRRGECSRPPRPPPAVQLAGEPPSATSGAVGRSKGWPGATGRSATSPIAPLPCACAAPPPRRRTARAPRWPWSTASCASSCGTTRARPHRRPSASNSMGRRETRCIALRAPRSASPLASALDCLLRRWQQPVLAVVCVWLLCC